MTDTKPPVRVRHLFELVCDLPPALRRARLAEEGAGDAEVAEIEALLAGQGTLDLGAREAFARCPSEGQETELDAGDRVGAWRLLRKFATGGMGAVYLAERADGHFEQLAAVKLIRGMADEDAFARFARERQILATLQHSRIARLLDGGATPGGQPYLVMEYIEGEPIDAYCERNGLPLAARLELFCAVCDAVEFAHRRLVVHCDLKPTNVLVGSTGDPVLLDFGIARALDTGRRDADSGRFYTPGYASPEQIRGEPLTTAVDVYALGLILFELVTGRKARLDTVDVTVAQLERAEVRPSDLAANVGWRIGADLDAIVLRATAERPESRYASAQALAADVRRFLQHRPVEARSPTLRYRFARAVRRRWPVALAAAAIVLLSAGFTWRLVAENARARAAEEEARQQAATAERVGDFLVSVFNVSNPKLNAGGRDVTAREILDQGAARIDEELAETPRVRARLLDVLATAYRHLGLPRPAADLFRRAIDAYLDPRVDQPLPAAAALSQLAVVYANAGLSPDDARAAAEQSLDLRRRFAPDDAVSSADSWNTLGVVLEYQAEYEAAREALEKALSLRQAGNDRLSLAATLHNLGLVAGRSGDSEAAFRWFGQALELKRELVGEHSVEYQTSLAGLAQAYAAAQQPNRALPLLERNLALSRELYGDASANVADALNELGSALHDLGRFAESATRYRDAMRVHAATSGEDGPAYAMPLNNLASAYEDMGDFAQSIPLFEQSLALRRKTLPDQALAVLRARSNLGRALTLDGRLAEARPQIDAALAAYRDRFGEDDAGTVKVMFTLADWQLRSGDATAAGATLQRLWASRARFTSLMRARRDQLAARVAAVEGRSDMALEHLRLAWESVRDGLGATHPYTAGFAMEYALALVRSGQAQTARELVRPIEAMIEATFVQGSPQRTMLASWQQEQAGSAAGG